MKPVGLTLTISCLSLSPFVRQKQLIRQHPVSLRLFIPPKYLTLSPVPSVTPIPTLTSSVGRLTGSLTALTVSHASHTAALTTLVDEQVVLESKEAEMRQMIEKAERKRSWFSAFRDWVEGIASFLDEKASRIAIITDFDFIYSMSFSTHL